MLLKKSINPRPFILIGILNFVGAFLLLQPISAQTSTEYEMPFYGEIITGEGSSMLLISEEETTTATSISLIISNDFYPFVFVLLFGMFFVGFLTTYFVL